MLTKPRILLLSNTHMEANSPRDAVTAMAPTLATIMPYTIAAGPPLYRPANKLELSPSQDTSMIVANATVENEFRYLYTSKSDISCQQRLGCVPLIAALTGTPALRTLRPTWSQGVIWPQSHLASRTVPLPLFRESTMPGTNFRGRN